ncbi:hypothetical protein [Williamsia soli]|uniref:hypothetical protein n=1 Tax=Williamsia soli TaxID=364929 RepID=UPI001A9FC66C|nr:hypothetical protein [Williamsia soli]
MSGTVHHRRCVYLIAVSWWFIMRGLEEVGRGSAMCLAVDPGEGPEARRPRWYRTECTDLTAVEAYANEPADGVQA